MREEIVVPEVEFIPRDYQTPLIKAVMVDGYRRVLAILPRRAGKDLTCWNILIRQAIKRVGVYWYVFPTYSQGRKILFDGIDSDGHKYLDYIPKQLVAAVNTHEMKIRLKNGSIIAVVGSDNYNNLVGTNACFMLFSEYSLQDPLAYSYLRPILMANRGIAMFISTPRGRNHLYDLFQIARTILMNGSFIARRLMIPNTYHLKISRQRSLKVT